VRSDLPEVRAPETAVQQIIDVLVGNALRHGAGSVAVTVKRLGDGVAVEVGDEGDGFDADLATSPSDPSSGLGLPLARSLSQLAGGSLVVENTGPAPVLRLLLPASRPVDVVHDPPS
jgi:signal transduction histidine kinase